MNAIKLLKDQHRLIELLFEQFEDSDEEDGKRALLFQIADHLAVHAAIEERYFYPAVRARQTEEEIEEAYDEHLEIKKLILEALDAVDAPGIDGVVAGLRSAVERHVEEEEEELFPDVSRLIDRDALDAIGLAMESEVEDLMAEGEPRRNIRVESEVPVIQP